ncbi:DNA end-binding protein Ku [Mycoplana sp. BE70]|uniref:non-homologous end joining protein Ku n=1 Tax=Mycoplana sp. BE70 TaxID=2817775 RepID=UPI0028583633|nr:Ku protein [Mycoplana sp. BE70]MDR6758884.1 DNA end-binding protein Ku [Mycoplana sp. BE70]
MVSRAMWKGQLRLSLVSIPVELFSATKSGGRTSFRQIHKPTGKPIHYEKIVEGVGAVKEDDIVKGYELDDGKYVLLQPKEIDAVKLETKKTLELVQFVGADEISPVYFDKPYYLVPADDLADDAYQVVRDALRVSGKTGLGQLTMRGREYLVAVRPCGDGLLLETLHYANELQKAEPIFAGIPKKNAEKDLLEVATQLIDRKTAPFDPTAFKDHYEDALKELVQQKMKGKAITLDEAGERRAATGGNVVDLMAALKKSLEGSGGPAKKSKPAATRRPKSA